MPSDLYQFQPAPTPKVGRDARSPAQWMVAGAVVETWVANMGFDSIKQSRP